VSSPVAKYPQLIEPCPGNVQAWFKEARRRIDQCRRDKEPRLRWKRGYNGAWTVKTLAEEAEH
jgi:hypothetical protein